jgi:hypothetical protein
MTTTGKFIINGEMHPMAVQLPDGEAASESLTLASPVFIDNVPLESP